VKIHPVATRWAELLQSYMDLRGLSQRALARELEVSSGVVSQWMGGSLPEHRSALAFAKRTGMDERQVLEAAALTVPESTSETKRYPEFLTEKLDQLTPAEQAVLAENAQGLLRLREERSTYEAGRPRRGRPRKAPPQSRPPSNHE
jgi:transcriptional regulator with XRE-family HTH domain